MARGKIATTAAFVIKRKFTMITLNVIRNYVILKFTDGIVFTKHYTASPLV